MDGTELAAARQRAFNAGIHLLSTAQEVGSEGTGDPASLLESYARAEADRAAALAEPFERPVGSLAEDAEAARRCTYRLARSVAANAAAAAILRETAPAQGLAQIQGGFPDIAQQIHDHVAQFGWIRTANLQLESLTPVALVDLVQGQVLRWPIEVLEELAGEEPPDELACGDPAPQESQVLGDALLLQAQAQLAPLFGRVASALGCTIVQVRAASTAELLGALSGDAPLPLHDLDGRVAAASAGHPVLTGLTACRGRAIGRVRIVSDASEVDALELGEILVSPASTTDYLGGRTVFPTRGGGPAEIDKAGAIVTNDGGLLSHAAVVCRERGLPGVLGTERATSVLRDGQVVEIDATKQVGTVVALG